MIFYLIIEDISMCRIYLVSVVKILVSVAKNLVNVTF
jgi:hypothetical protein